MILLLKSIINFLINPLHILIILMAVSGWWYVRKKYRRLKRTMLFFALFFLLTASYPFPDFLIGQLEGQYTPLQDLSLLRNDSVVHILILGSGHTLDPDLPAIDQLSSTALHRLVEGIRLHHKLPGSQLILSGYAGETAIAQAKILTEAAATLGVSRQAMRMQQEPSTTSEEARVYKEKFGTTSRLILVTSASHMPRAMLIFKNQDLNPIPAPTNYEVKKDPLSGLDLAFFSHENFYKIQRTLHEYVGLLWEKLVGSG